MQSQNEKELSGSEVGLAQLGSQFWTHWLLKTKGKYICLIMVINYKSKAFKSIFRDTFISKLKFKKKIITWILTVYTPVFSFDLFWA